MSGSSLAVVVYWIAMLALTIGLIAWEFRDPPRFTLRRLLVVMTWVAILLGLFQIFI
jgi:hypothetical protein